LVSPPERDEPESMTAESFEAFIEPAPNAEVLQRPDDERS
jgi:hypothetical protein